MFTHAEASGQKEYDQGICQGHCQPLPERDVQAEVPALELLTHESTQEEIMVLYHQVYHLKRNLGEVPFSGDTAEETCIKTLEILKACLQCRWGPTQPEEMRGRSASTRTTRMSAQENSTLRCRQPMTTWPFSRQAAGVPGGNPKSSQGCSLPGTSHGGYARRTHRVAEPLLLLWMA